MQQSLNRCQIPARRASFGVWSQRTAHVIVVVHQQVNRGHVIQVRAEGVQAQRLDRRTMKSGDGARDVPHTMIDQRDLGRFAVIAKQLNINV